MIIILNLLLFSTFSSAQLGFQLSEQNDKISIPISLHSNLIVLPLVLNHRLPLKFILDTGVRNAVLTDRTYTDILKIPYTKKFSILGAGGSQLIDAYLTSAVSLNLPNVTGDGHVLLVLEEDYIMLRNYLGTDIHGMLGYELFSRFVIKLDYQNRRITLYDRAKYKPSKKYIRIPLTIEDTKPYMIMPIKFENGTVIQAKLLIDTGASHGLMLDPESNDSIVVPRNNIDAIIGRGLGGDIEGQIGRVESIILGKYELKKFVASFPYANSYLDSLLSLKISRNGSIGGELLSRFTLILDYSEEVMYIKKNKAFKKPNFYNLSGLTIRAVGSSLNVFEITEVRPGSNAGKIGIEKDDIILSINNIQSNKMSLNDVTGFLNSKPGKKVKLVVKRGVDLKTFTFRLYDAI
ncbi:MAG: aspartyl protease family protein [Cyclobacteriaceae bacterium]|nr:aspartyl protease family protein [Cyclobacteriaceae bacterium]